jgi:hypothetical protein
MKRLLSPLVIVAALALVVPLRAEEVRETTAGPQYEASGWFRFLFGSGHRELWTTPIHAPVLDISKEAGGLVPVRQVGGQQTLGLALSGKDGRAYTFRSLHKRPDRILPPDWREGVAGHFVRDATSGTHPAASVIYSALAEAAGVPAPEARLVILADHPDLGAFRKDFADQLGTFEEYPLPEGPRQHGFLGASEILSTRELWTRRLEDPGTRIDSHAFLRARLLDLWLDNYDRHGGQWRFMRLPGDALLDPLPEDPDMVLLHHDGVVKSGMRSSWVPRLLEFGASYPRRLDGPLMNAWGVDRWLLAELEAPAFEQAARALQGRLGDDVIERALRRMPPEWYAVSGARTLAALVARRERLGEYALRVYRYYAETVDVQASDRPERVEVAHEPDGAVLLTLAPAGDASSPYYRRRFAPGETREVRVHLHGGDDVVESRGPGDGPIRVRVIAGGGRKRVDDSRGGGTEVWPDVGVVEVTKGPGTEVRAAGWRPPKGDADEPWSAPRSFGHWTIPHGSLWWTPDTELLIGAGFTRTSWGFRAEPYRAEHTLRAAFATADATGKVEYVGTLRRRASGLGFRLQTFASGLEHLNFFGFGNESEEQSDRSRYRSEYTEALVAPSLLLGAGRHLELSLGADLRYSTSPSGEETLLGQAAPYGSGSFGSLGMRGGLVLDTRPRPRRVRLGLGEEELRPAPDRATLRVGGFYVPAAWDADSDYGGIDAELTGSLGSERAHVALRAGGRKVWGRYAWFDAAFLGGGNARAFRSNRFAGDASLYAGAELRAWFGTLDNPILPLRLGGFALAESGRVFFAGESSDTWHHSFGGGLLLQPLGFPLTAHATVATGDEGTRFYFGSGYSF